MASTKSVTYRDIEGWPGYRVGSDASVWSRRKIGGDAGEMTDEWRLRKPTLNKQTGYLMVGLQRPGGRRMATIHTLVIEAFHGPRPCRLAQCRHLDGNKLNNLPSNLAWGTPAENIADALRHGDMPVGTRNRKAKLCEANVAESRRLAASGWNCRQLAAMFGVSSQTMNKAVRGDKWAHVTEPPYRPNG